MKKIQDEHQNPTYQPMPSAKERGRTINADFRVVD